MKLRASAPRDAIILNSINRSGMTESEGFVNRKFRIFNSFLPAFVIPEKGVTSFRNLFRENFGVNRSKGAP